MLIIENKMKNKFHSSLMILLLIFCFFVSSSFAGSVPPYMNYQGLLKDTSTGNNLATGEYQIKFVLYDAPEGAPGAIEVWSQIIEPVKVVDGHFSVLLGGEENSLPNSFNSPDRFIEVHVGSVGDIPDNLVKLSNRQRIVGVGYAFRAETANNADTLENKHANAFALASHPHSNFDNDISISQPNKITSSSNFLQINDGVGNTILDGGAVRLRTNGTEGLALTPDGDVHINNTLYVNGIDLGNCQGLYSGFTGTSHFLGSEYTCDGWQKDSTPDGYMILHRIDANIKNFRISHPLYPEEQYLIHSSLEGPEIAVYYRGEANLIDGEVVIDLPNYFEALTRKEGRTVLLTKIDGFDDIAVKTVNGTQVNDGKFVVYSNNRESLQKFNWEIKAIRADVEILDVKTEKP